LVGRYGILAIGVVAAVAAVGTFLNWAITRGYLQLGPAARVFIGLAVAAALGTWGFRLRRRERSFGSTILGLALVIVQVCAYAAGPAFHLVPSSVAFAGAAVISWALAIFAHAENDEPLWCVGFGGAALAPFVTSDGRGNVFVLAAYGAIVLLPACFAISHRDWPVGWRVFYAAGALFTLACARLAGIGGSPAFATAVAFPLIIAGAGVIPFAPAARKRGALRWLAGFAVIAAFAAHAVDDRQRALMAAIVLVAIAVWLIILDRHATVAQSSILDGLRDNAGVLDWIDAALIPLALAAQSEDVIATTRYGAISFAVAALFCLAFTWRRRTSALRDAAAFASVATACGVIGALPIEAPLGRVTGLVALALACILAHRMRPSVTWVVMAGGLMIGVAGMAAITLVDRIAYTFTPFATEPSAAAAVVLIAFILVARFWQWLRSATRAALPDRPEWTYAVPLRRLVRGATVAPWVWAFVWVMLELAMAFSPSTSTLLLVTYFAATAVACVAAGRARRAARLRQVGLALALIAASTAFYGASSYFDFGARILAYLVTSAFLLGIAYWYRRPGAEGALG
jgi:hypothetical protein